MNPSSSRPLLQHTRTALFALALLCLPVAALSETIVSVAIAPPALPIYEQPIAPGPGHIWTPGYWAYGPAGYYWVPGTWVLAPFAGALWTPGYWGWGNGVYLWHGGYWGPRVGYYGGVNYGYGYTGWGYHGGYWRGGAFYYNRAVNHIDTVNIHNTYSKTIENVNASRVSYNGGAGGTRARPNAAQQAYMGQSHTSATAGQLQHEQAAAGNRAMFASENHGQPSIAATPHPGGFDHPGVTAAGPAQTHNATQRAASEHPRAHPQGGPQGHAHAEGGGEGHHAK
jgi:hypothetical protein